MMQADPTIHTAVIVIATALAFQAVLLTSANLAIGIVAGLALGAGVALLFAPKTGASMREDIGESVGTLRAAVGRRLRDLADRAGVEVADIGVSVDRATEAVESTAREMVKVAAQGIRSATT